MKNLQCPYQNMSCSELDTSGMTKPGCEKCEHYGDGVRYTGAINLFKDRPILNYIKMKWEKWSLYIVIIISSIILSVLIYNFICN